MTAGGLSVTTIGTWSHSWEGSGVSQEDTKVERVVFQKQGLVRWS